MEESIASRFFGIDELLRLVLAYLTPASGFRVSLLDARHVKPDTLANLARVSRKISGPALDALWSSINQPEAIIGLLPVDAVELTDGDGDAQYRLTRPLAPEDFVNFDKYAPRIHCVDFTGPARYRRLTPGCELLPYIKDFRDPIFPALKEFIWEPSANKGAVGAFHLLSREASVPRDEFHLLSWQVERGAVDSDAMAKTFDAFTDPGLPWLPNVKRLTLCTHFYSPPLRPNLGTLPNVEHFSCQPRISTSSFEDFSALPNLRRLDIRLLKGDFDYIHTSLLASLFPPTISACAASLVHFEFVNPKPIRWAHEGPAPLQFAIFTPLYECSGMQVFSVDASRGARLVITDSDVRAMARSWPALRVLSLQEAARPASAHGLHLYDTLWPLATECPQLSRLELTVDSDVAKAFNAENQRNDHEVEMESVILNSSPCGDPLLIADFLNKAFPRFSAEAFVAFPTKERQEDAEKWAKVAAALASSRLVEMPSEFLISSRSQIHPRVLVDENIALADLPAR
ncbi:hypothetical protein B0H16DRAFT_1717594 [Mycena metata]|uniref:F-box domain-containing protein n=1 Tax=Mycena metata TaxID=1033252 RepID=A0AAD7JIS1_9AGAR|nr:hypothetical protein B0H16DRAFT_1717594 [Mycena metata]